MGVRWELFGLKAMKSSMQLHSQHCRVSAGDLLFWVTESIDLLKRAVGCMGKQKWGFSASLLYSQHCFLCLSFIRISVFRSRCNGISIFLTERERGVFRTACQMVNLNRGSCCHGDGRLHPTTRETKVKKLMLRLEVTWHIFVLFCF